MRQQAHLGIYCGVNAHTAALFSSPEGIPEYKDIKRSDLRHLRILFTYSGKKPTNKACFEVSTGEDL